MISYWFSLPFFVELDQVCLMQRIGYLVSVIRHLLCAFTSSYNITLCIFLYRKRKFTTLVVLFSHCPIHIVLRAPNQSPSPYINLPYAKFSYYQKCNDTSKDADHGHQAMSLFEQLRTSRRSAALSGNVRRRRRKWCAFRYCIAWNFGCWK